MILTKYSQNQRTHRRTPCRYRMRLEVVHHPELLDKVVQTLNPTLDREICRWPLPLA